MKIIDDVVLAQFRGPGHCELCGRLAPKREPHHAFSRGAGRLDIRENLVAVSAHDAFVCLCHRRAQKYEIPRKCLLAVIALREGTTPEAIVEKIYQLRRAPKTAA